MSSLVHFKTTGDWVISKEDSKKMCYIFHKRILEALKEDAESRTEHSVMHAVGDPESDIFIARLSPVGEDCQRIFNLYGVIAKEEHGVLNAMRELQALLVPEGLNVWSGFSGFSNEDWLDMLARKVVTLTSIWIFG